MQNGRDFVKYLRPGRASRTLRKPHGFVSQQVIAQLRTEGHPVGDGDLAHFSPPASSTSTSWAMPPCRAGNLTVQWFTTLYQPEQVIALTAVTA